MNTERITLRLPRDLYRQIIQLAKANERSLNAQIIFMLKLLLETPKPHTIKEGSEGGYLIGYSQEDYDALWESTETYKQLTEKP